MRCQKMFLLLAAGGLLPIALSYGLVPVKTMNFLYNIEIEKVNAVHICRGIMGLYLGMIALWLIGAMKPTYEKAAICALIAFMLGLAAGRALSLIVDGGAHWLLVGYMFTEIGFGVAGIFMLKKSNQTPEADGAT